MRLKTTIKPVSGAPEDLDTIDADAIIWLPHAQGLELKKFWMPLRNASKLVAASGKKSSSYAGASGSSMPMKTPDSTSMSHRRVPSMGILRAMARQAGSARSGNRLEGEQPDPLLQLAASGFKTDDFVGASGRRKSQRAFDAATQDPLPQYEDYLDQDPLRATIKLLKRHRDEWAIRTKNADHRPISAVITTLATHAYLEVAKESQTAPLKPLDAILEIVRRMPDHVKRQGMNAWSATRRITAKTSLRNGIGRLTGTVTAGHSRSGMRMPAHQCPSGLKASTPQKLLPKQ
ncbi:hypothetical protein P4234_00780 [Pseudomonas aeruginosa]|nr:hypothetical protein [Pseudomonas aeruginosa]